MFKHILNIGIICFLFGWFVGWFYLDELRVYGIVRIFSQGQILELVTDWGHFY